MTVQRPNPFPPFIPPFINDTSFGDMEEIDGLFILDNSTDALLHENTEGRFVCSPEVELSSGMSVRRVSDNTTFHVRSARKSPKIARSQVAMYEAQVLERGESP